MQKSFVWYHKLVIVVLLLCVGVGISLFVFALSYCSHNICPNPVIQYFIKGPPGQPESREEAQKRTNFTIFRPTYKPANFNLEGSLILFGNDKFAKLNYGTKLDSNLSYGLQLEETKVTPEQTANISKEGILANDPYATNIKQIEVCGSVGYLGISKTAQDLIFIKDGTRILLTYFTSTPIDSSHFYPLTDQEILRVACSLQPLTSSK